MAEAESIVKPQYPAEIQVENIGTSSRGSANTAEDIDIWNFIFTDIVVASLRDAGFKEPFQSVTLRAPFPVEKNAYYVFKFENKTVYIDALTGKVDRVVEEA